MIKLTLKFLDGVLEMARQDGCIQRDSEGEWRLKFDAVTIELVGVDRFKVGLSYKGEQVGIWELDVELGAGHEHLTLAGLEGTIPFAVRTA